MVFIRAPYIEAIAPKVEVMAEIDGHIAAVRYQNQLALSFHPEVTENTSVYEYFLTMVKERRKKF